jgi:hypothetical protein
MSLFTWLQHRTRRFAGQRKGAHSSPRRQTTFRPRLEVLEGREVPSTLTVTNNRDTGIAGDGSLRGEITAAQNGDTIVFSQSLKGQTITLNKSELYINKSLDIEGLGAKNLAISGGNQYWRVFEVAPLDVYGQRVQVTLSGMTIENGNAVLGNVVWGTQYPQAQGGGILNYGSLTLSGCTVTGNHASQGGGGIANELGGTMTISSCTVSRNFSNVVLGVGGWGGGGIYNDGTMTLSGSTVTQNQGYGIWNDYNGILTILNSIVKNNWLGNKPGDLHNLGTWSVDSSSTIG